MSAIDYAIAIDWDDDGVFGPEDDISPDVLQLEWRLGMAAPGESVAPPGQAAITVRSRSRIYSPEASSQPLAPGRPLRISSRHGQQMRVHFTGFITQIEPIPGADGPRRAVIHAATVDAAFEQAIARLPPLTNARADAIIAALFDALPLRRRALAGRWVLGVAGFSAVGSAVLAGPAIAPALEPGISTFAYVGDLWDVPAIEALRDAVASERGRFFIDREGTPIFHNRHRHLRPAPTAAIFNDDMSALDYAYPPPANLVRVSFRPRAVGAPDSPLWTLTSPQRLPPGTTTMAARFRDSSGQPLGALAISRVVFSANTAADGSGSPVAVTAVLREAAASAALIEWHNPSSAPAFLLPGTQVRGTPLISGDPLTIAHQDERSITFHGLRGRDLRPRLLSSIDEADQMARFELARGSRPRGIVRAIAVDARARPAALGLTLFDRIVIAETQTGHSGAYLIIAEQHTVELGGGRHRIRLLLEPADQPFWTLGTAALEAAVLAY
jgi:hypothetical protein